MPFFLRSYGTFDPVLQIYFLPVRNLSNISPRDYGLMSARHRLELIPSSHPFFPVRSIYFLENIVVLDVQ